MSAHSEAFQFFTSPDSPTINGFSPQPAIAQSVSSIFPVVEPGFKESYGYNLCNLPGPYPKLVTTHLHPTPNQLTHGELQLPATGIPLVPVLAPIIRVPASAIQVPALTNRVPAPTAQFPSIVHSPTSAPVASPSIEPLPLTFPSEEVTKRLTDASFIRSPIDDLKGQVYNNWALTLPIPVPGDIVHPTLTSVSYAIKYTAGINHQASIIKAGIFLASGESASQILEIPQIAIDQPDSEGGASVLCLLSSTTTKPCEQVDLLTQFTDSREGFPNIRITDAQARLYLCLHVVEHPAAAMTQALAVEALATWSEDLAGRHLRDERDQARFEAAQAKAEAARERDRADQAESKAEMEERSRIQAEQHAAAAEQAKQAAEAACSQAKEAAQKAADAQKAAESRAEAEKNARITAERKIKLQSSGPAQADAETQEKIQKALAKHPERQCPQGFAWLRTGDGYKCGGGGHSISFEELAAMDD